MPRSNRRQVKRSWNKIARWGPCPTIGTRYKQVWNEGEKQQKKRAAPAAPVRKRNGPSSRRETFRKVPEPLTKKNRSPGLELLGKSRISCAGPTSKVSCSPNTGGNQRIERPFPSPFGTGEFVHQKKKRRWKKSKMSEKRNKGKKGVVKKR